MQSLKHFPSHSRRFLMGMLCGISILFHSGSVAALSLQQGSDGLTFTDIQKINKEVQAIYRDFLEKEMHQYVRGVLKFTTPTCQIRYPEWGCVTYRKTGGTWTLRMDLKTSWVLKLKGFHTLEFIRKGNGRRSIVIEDARNHLIRFPFRGRAIQDAIVPLGNTRLTLEQIDNLVFEANYLFYEHLKPAMDQYHGEQLDYPLSRCERVLSKIGCGAFGENQHLWTLTVRFKRQVVKDLSGFVKLLYRKGPDGVAELEFSDRKENRVYFPVINGVLKDVFLPFPS